MLVMSFFIQKVQQHISTFVCIYLDELPKMTGEQFFVTEESACVITTKCGQRLLTQKNGQGLKINELSLILSLHCLHRTFNLHVKYRHELHSTIS